jgi:hypothetical protein
MSNFLVMFSYYPDGGGSLIGPHFYAYSEFSCLPIGPESESRYVCHIS